MTRFWRIALICSLVGNLAVFYVALKAIEYRNHINFFLEKYTDVSDEFSQRDKYYEKNQALPHPTDTLPRIVFLGTQVTERWPLDSQLEGFDPINRGVYGQRAAGLLLRFWSDVAALHPKGVVIEISSYNLRPETGTDELQELVKSLVNLASGSRIIPIVSTMVPAREGVTGLGTYQLHDSITLYNAWIKRFGDSAHIPILDFDALLADSNGYLRPELASDDIDPNGPGYAVMTGRIQMLLDSLFPRSVQIGGGAKSTRTH